MSAMEAGADAAATSMHKLGGSLTQSSVLNVQGDRISSDRVQAVLSMLTTTSTSYHPRSRRSTLPGGICHPGPGAFDPHLGAGRASRGGPSTRSRGLSAWALK